MKKRFLSLLLAVAMLLSLTPQIALGVGAESVSWSYDPDTGVLTISGDGAMEDYAAPEDAPYYEEDVYALVVEEGVTAIGQNAFGGMYLDNVRLPVSLTAIGENAFANAVIAEAHYAGNIKQWTENVNVATGNSALTNEIVMDQDVTYDADGLHLANGHLLIEYDQWYNSVSISDEFKAEYGPYVLSVEYADGTEVISNYSLRNMQSVLSVTIPDSVTSIGDHAFYGCTGLNSVTIPDSVTSIGLCALYGCYGLTSVTIGNSVTSIGNYAFYGCTGLNSVTIPDGVTSIGGCAFRDCTGLTSVTIGNSVTSIGDQAFYGCYGLTSVTIPDSVTSIGIAAFSSCTSLNSVTIGNSVTSIGDQAFYGCYGLTSVTIPDSVTSIDTSAFQSCTGLTSVTIGNSVTSIGMSAFSGCYGLTSVTIPDSVTSIGIAAFSSCTSLNSVTIGNSVTSIGEGAFEYCGRLTSVTIPDSVTSLGGGAFRDCYSLASVTIGDSVTSIAFTAFYGCTGLTSVTIPDSVTSIDNYAFSGCTGLTDVYYDGTLSMWEEISIGTNNEPLTNANIHFALACGETGEDRWSILWDGTLKITGTGTMADYAEGEAPWLAYEDQITGYLVKPLVKNIGAYAFVGLEDLTEISGMEGVTAIGEGAFKDCAGLTALNLPETLKTVGAGAFENCAALTGLTIPASVTSMGQNAFAGCALLSSAGPIGSEAAIQYGWPRIIPANAFSGADCLELVTLPDAATRIMAGAFQNCAALTAIEFPETLTLIQADAFAGSGLTEAILPASVRTLGDSAFATPTLTHIWVKNPTCSIGSAADTLGDPAVTHVCGAEDSAAAAFAEQNGYTLHDFGEWSPSVPATCTEAGEESRTCAFCGETETHVLDALGHDYVDGICTRCGAADPDYHPMIFTDVAQDAYYADAVQWAVENGVTVGTSDTTFSPNQACTRAQIVTFLWRAVGSPVPTLDTLPFTDVQQTAYYYDAVRWAVENGITNGVSETSFCPNRTCSRSEAVTFLWRASGSPVPTQTEMPFTDVAGDTWYTTPVLWAVENNITSGTSDTTFSPKQKCNRAQIVTFLWRTSQIPE